MKMGFEMDLFTGGYYLRLRIKNVRYAGTQGVGDESSNYIQGSQKESPSFWTARSGWAIVNQVP